MPLELSRADKGRPSTSCRFSVRIPDGRAEKESEPLRDEKSGDMIPLTPRCSLRDNFERISRAEPAQMPRVLGMSKDTEADRSFRARKWLTDAQSTLPGGWEGL
jgi:hypothetical protein